MQAELDTLTAAPNVRIFGVNQVGQEAGNALICEGRNLPWLQETMDSLVWIPWKVTYRDVVILDGQNRRVAVFNLTEHNLAHSADYDSLRALLLDLSR